MASDVAALAPVLASVPLRPAALTVDGRGTLALAPEPAALAKVVALDVRSVSSPT